MKDVTLYYCLHKSVYDCMFPYMLIRMLMRTGHSKSLIIKVKHMRSYWSPERWYGKTSSSSYHMIIIILSNNHHHMIIIKVRRIIKVLDSGMSLQALSMVESNLWRENSLRISLSTTCHLLCYGGNNKLKWILREAILQKIPEFYEFFFTNGGGGQPDFISLIQKLLS